MMNRPSLRTGFRLSLKLRSLLLALWIMPILLFSPLRALVSASAGRALQAIPEGFTTPPGDVGLLASHALIRLAPALGILILSSLVLMWVWTILWHAGLCRWLVWDGETKPSLRKILGHGVLSWLRYLRLSLWAWLMFVMLFGGLCTAGFLLIQQAWDAMNEDRMVLLILITVVLLVLVKIILWAATLRGAWELVVPGKKSSVLAWFRGLRGALIQPVGTLLPTAVFGILIAGCLTLPLLLHIGAPSFRTGWRIWAVLGISGLLAAYLQLWLFTTMAPITGLLPTGTKMANDTTLNSVETHEKKDLPGPQSSV